MGKGNNSSSTIIFIKTLIVALIVAGTYWKQEVPLPFKFAPSEFQEFAPHFSSSH